jgi:type IV pilus assembly protein PilC
MPTFTFVARNQQGQEVSGVRAAASRQELIGRLRTESLVPTTISQDAESLVGPAVGAFAEFKEVLLHGRITQADLMVTSRQLSAMLKAGISLTEALHTAAHSSGNERLRQVLLNVRADVQRGRTLTDSFRKYPNIFDPLFVSIVQSGEASGGLAQNIARLAAYLDRKEKFRRKLKSATAYPKFVVIFFVVLTSVILLVLIPKFKELFSQFNAKLPAPTQIMMNISVFLRNNILVLLACAVVLVIAFVFARRSRWGKTAWDRTVLHIPFFGRLFLQAAVARMSMTLSTLLSNGIPLTEAMPLATNTLNNSVIEEACARARNDVIKGRGLAESLARVPQLPRLLPRMVRVGEESGTLSGMLEDVSDYFDQEVDLALSRLTAVIEPVLICGMGAVVLVTVIAIYLPIFSLGRTVAGGG